MIVPKKIPDLKQGNLDPHSETELHQAFQRIYEYIDAIIKDSIRELEEKIKVGDLISIDYNTLIGIFSQPLAGSSTTDPLLQSILQSFGNQLANTIFASPSGIGGIPTFRSLVAADIPAGIGITNSSGINEIPKTDAGGDLVTSQITDDGNLVDIASIVIINSVSQLFILNVGLLPTADPAIPGAVWRDVGDVLKVSP